MKNRIIALILVIATSLLTLVGCFGTVDAGRINYVADGYATFDSAAFDAGIKNIVIKDGSFTTNEATRIEKVASEIYTKVTDAIIKAAGDEDKLTAGELDANDVLYFVYYAVNAETGEIYFTADMKESAITASSSSAKHVVKLGEDYSDNEFLKLVQENVALGTIDEYIYAMDADKVSADDYKPAEGAIVYISYTRTYTDDEAAVITESAAYEKVTVTAGEALSDKLIAGETEFDLELDGKTYSYKDVKVLFEVESEGKAIASFDYVPYTTSQTPTPDGLRKNDATKTDLKEVALTYYVFPVSYIAAYDAPNADDVKGDADYSIVSAILEFVYGSALDEADFDIFTDEGYIFEGEKVTDLVKSVAGLYTPVVDTKDESKTGDFYKLESELRKLYDAHAEAVKEGGSNPTGDKKTAIDDAKAALKTAQDAELAKIVAKIVKATKADADSAPVAIYKQYLEDNYNDLLDAYNKHIVEEVQAEVWALIKETVTVKNYPEKLLKEFKNHVAEALEYEYYTGAQTTGDKKAFIDVYETIEEYAKSTDCTSLSTTPAKDATLDAITDAEAKYHLDPIIKIFVVSQHVEADAKAALPAFYQSDIDKGAYDVHLEDYVEAYGEDKAQKKYEEAVERAEDSKEFTLEHASDFIIDNDFLKAYKKYIGKSSYNMYIESYGEINLRAAEQFNKLFYYLTSTDLADADEDHVNAPAYTEANDEGIIYIAFRTVKYTTEGETEVEADDDHEGHDH